MIAPEILEAEQLALETDKAFYMECLNDKPLKNRHTLQEIRNGLILYWHVYRFITNQKEGEQKCKKPKHASKKSKKQ